MADSNSDAPAPTVPVGIPIDEFLTGFPSSQFKGGGKTHAWTVEEHNSNYEEEGSVQSTSDSTPVQVYVVHPKPE
jgi:hypothetical protein